MQRNEPPRTHRQGYGGCVIKRVLCSFQPPPCLLTEARSAERERGKKPEGVGEAKEGGGAAEGNGGATKKTARMLTSSYHIAVHETIVVHTHVHVKNALFFAPPTPNGLLQTR